MSITEEEIDAVIDLVDDLCGIYLDRSKSYLIEGRLGDLVMKHGCDDYLALTRKARLGSGKELVRDVIDAITTNETLWFRDSSPFEAIKNKAIPEIIDSNIGSTFPKRLRIWSAACSTGQEVYSIAMTLADLLLDLDEWDIEILGTDICASAVAKAKVGRYSELEVSRGLEHVHLSGFFNQRGDEWEVCDTIRSICRFETRNLLQPFQTLGPFDIIFCRNVAIYFTKDVRNKLFHDLAGVLSPSGWIFTGAAELLAELGPNWQPQQHCRATCYQPNSPNIELARLS